MDKDTIYIIGFAITLFVSLISMVTSITVAYITVKANKSKNKAETDNLNAETFEIREARKDKEITFYKGLAIELLQTIQDLIAKLSSIAVKLEKLIKER